MRVHRLLCAIRSRVVVSCVGALAAAGLLVTCASAPGRGPGSGPRGSVGPPFSPQVVAPGQGRATGYLGDSTTLIFQGRTGTDEVSVLEVVLPPRTLGSPPHLHHHEDEYFYVVEGEIKVLVGQEERAAGRGTHAALPRELRHAYWNDSDAPARVLITIAPGRFAQFFLDVAADLKRRGETDPQRIGPIIAEHAKLYEVDVFLDQVPALVQQHGLR